MTPAINGPDEAAMNSRGLGVPRRKEVEMNIAVPGYKEGRRPPFVLAAVAGVSLGIAAAIGIWQVADPGPNASTPAVSALASRYESYGTDTRTLWLYLVDSAEQEELLRFGEQEAARERWSSGIPDPEVTILILKVTTPEDEAVLSEALEAWSTAPGGIRLVDLRGQ